MSKNFHAFLSYAGEDRSFVDQLAGALKARGFNIWHADSVLEPGDKLLESIERGLRDSSYGILLISPDYLRKGWTRYEMDILIRQHIEHGKRLFPIWHKVEKQELEARSPGLAGIFALRSDLGFQAIVNRMSKFLSPGVSTQALIPGWESASYRFTQGIGELILTSNGATFNLWEALLHFRPEKFPIAINGEVLPWRHFWLKWILAPNPSPSGLPSPQPSGQESEAALPRQPVDAEVPMIQGQDTANALALCEPYESGVRHVHRQILVLFHQALHGCDIGLVELEKLDGAGLDQLWLTPEASSLHSDASGGRRKVPG
jgi:hypothetical protein